MPGAEAADIGGPESRTFRPTSNDGPQRPEGAISKRRQPKSRAGMLRYPSKSLPRDRVLWHFMGIESIVG